MVITNKIIKNNEQLNKAPDIVWLHWYETNKRILHKKTASGKNISLRFLNENPAFEPGDILYEDQNSLVMIDILPAEAIVVKPATMFEMASLCYEIGNKHLPLFYENETLVLPYESPFHKYLIAAGYQVAVEEKKLLHPLRTTVSPHGNTSETLFSKIMKLTAEKK